MNKDLQVNDPKAIALRYDGLRAPHVVASGKHETAERIIEIAKEHDITIVQDNELTQLLAQIPLGDSIPEALYVAVAEVLTFVYSITGNYPATIDSEQ